VIPGDAQTSFHRLKQLAFDTDNEEYRLELHIKSGAAGVEADRVSGLIRKNIVRLKGLLKLAVDDVKHKRLCMLSLGIGDVGHTNSGLPMAEALIRQTTPPAEVFPESCVVCYKAETPVLARCGHFLCEGCHFNEPAQCPICACKWKRSSFGRRSVENAWGGRLSIDNEVADRLGTKKAAALAFLAGTLSDDPSARIIVFSQDDVSLKIMGKELTTAGMQWSSVKGTVAEKNKSIARFKSGETRILLLSTEKSASGTNLVEASHIVMLDPISGSIATAVAAEKQAVGRADRQGQTNTVRLVRIVAKDTAEHVLHHRNMLELRAEHMRQQGMAGTSSVVKRLGEVNGFRYNTKSGFSPTTLYIRK
jgi:hypothetical protein